MTGTVRGEKRGRIKVWLLSDNANRPALEALSYVPVRERKPGVWLGWYYTDDWHPPDGLWYFACMDGRLLESNHPHWKNRTGFAFGERWIP